MKNNNSIKASNLTDWYDGLDIKKKAMILTILSVLSFSLMFILMCVLPIFSVIMFIIVGVCGVLIFIYKIIYLELEHQEFNRRFKL